MREDDEKSRRGGEGEGSKNRTKLSQFYGLSSDNSSVRYFFFICVILFLDFARIFQEHLKICFFTFLDVYFIILFLFLVLHLSL